MYRFLGCIHGGNTVEKIRSNFAYKIEHNLRLCTTTTINSVVVLHFGLSYCITVPYTKSTLGKIGAVVMAQGIAKLSIYWDMRKTTTQMQEVVQVLTLLRISK